MERRVAEHKSGDFPGFSRTYNLNKLVWYEEIPNAKDCIEREKQLKNWHREWKLSLIEEMNPEWKDLSKV